MIVRGELSVQNKAEAAVMQHFGKAVRRRMKNATPDHCELVYEGRSGLPRRLSLIHI